MVRAMTALHELSMRLSLFTRSVPLSTLRQPRGHGYDHHHSLHMLNSASLASGSLPSLASWIPLSRRTYDLKGGRSEISGSRAPGTDGTSYDGLERRDVIGSFTNVLEPAASERSEDSEGAASGSRDFGKYAQKEVQSKEGQATNYLSMSDKELFSKCRMDTYRASGPGGQHRNKTESAVRLTHIPTGLVSQAADDRSQHINRALALTRLRQVIALEVRDLVELEGYKPVPELIRILPSGTNGKRSNAQKIGPNHPDFVLGLKHLLDLLWAVGGSVSAAGTVLGMSTGALSKLITSNNILWQGVNKLRASKGLKPLR